MQEPSAYRSQMKIPMVMLHSSLLAPSQLVSLTQPVFRLLTRTLSAQLTSPHTSSWLRPTLLRMKKKILYCHLSTSCVLLLLAVLLARLISQSFVVLVPLLALPSPRPTLLPQVLVMHQLSKVSPTSLVTLEQV